MNILSKFIFVACIGFIVGFVLVPAFVDELLRQDAQNKLSEYEREIYSETD